MPTSPPAPSTALPPDRPTAETRGLLLGLLGVTLFAFSIPMTRLAGGTAEAPQLDPIFVAFGRAVGAAACAALYLLAVRARRPASADLRPLAVTALGVVFGWPIFIGLALREVEGTHASVVSGVLPLVTAMFAAWRLRQRASLAFWVAAVTGCALVLAFAGLREWQAHGRVGVSWADLLLLAAICSASAGYVGGARLAGRMPPGEVICWVLLLSLPLTLPVTWLTFPRVPVSAAAWTGFAYVSVFSMWLGMLIWYRALALGGTLRVSQVQLLQPFLSLLFCVPVLGESLDALTVGFSLAIIATVAWSRRTAVRS